MDVRRAKELLQHDVHAPHHLGEQEVVARAVPDVVLLLVPALRFGETEVGWWRAFGGGGSPDGGGEGVLLLCGEGCAGRGGDEGVRCRSGAGERGQCAGSGHGRVALGRDSGGEGRDPSDVLTLLSVHGCGQ